MITISGERKMKAINMRLLSSTISILVMVLCYLHVISGGDAALTKPHCRSKCGDVNISYPFGFTDDAEDCYLPNFDITCNNSYNPPKSFYSNFEVLGMSLESAQMRVLMDISYDCYNSSGSSDYNSWDLTLSSVFKFSYTENIYTAVGCDTYAYIIGGGERNYTGGCISVCGDGNNIPDGSCSGIGCCQTSIPEGLRIYSTSIGSFYNHNSILDFNNCSYSFLVEKNNYTFNKTDLTYMDEARMFPIVWDWSIGEKTCDEDTKNSSNYACVSKNSHCHNSNNGDGYLCNCSLGYQGNPYLQDGCQDIDECQEPNTYFCNGTCTNFPGSFNCTCPNGTYGDPKAHGCTPIPKLLVNQTSNTGNKNTSNTSAAILVPALVLSFLGIVSLGVFIYVQLQRRKLTQLRYKYFLQNGGAILEQQITRRNGMERRFKVFTMDEIEKATNKFDESMILGRGGQGIVYKGKLPNDSDTYAIKKSLYLDGSKVEEFINEMVILSQINHRNVVKLLGCCLEEENPLLVYEFVPNGTLFQHIRRGSIPWDVRLNIGVEIAGALGYLHSSVCIPIIHGDVKSSNILLEGDYTAKVSDFGSSRLIPVNETQFNTIVQGTLGYLDPEYIQTHELTDKSDVYSFGVVLVELLTGKTPVSSGRQGEPRTLATYFLSCMGDGSICQILDDQVAIGGNNIVGEMIEVANIAKRCLNLRGEERPSMMEVAMELQRLRVESHPWHPLNVEMATTQELLVPTSLTSSSIHIDRSVQISDEISLLRSPKSGR